MTLDELSKIVTTDFINEILSARNIHAPQVSLLGSKAAEFPFLVDGASNNALFLDLDIASIDHRIPNELVLKAGNNAGGTTQREILFYNLLEKKGGIPEVPACYATGWFQELDLGVLLLEKVAADAIVFEVPVEKHLEHYQRAIEILADLHAHWWGDSNIGVGTFEPLWTNDLLSAATAWAKNAQLELVRSGEVSKRDAKILDIALSIAQPLLSERAAQANLCVNHGDAGLWNFVMDQHDPTLVKLVDFQMWCVAPPAWDIGYMIYLLWPTEFRSRFGARMVKAYLDRLSERGIIYSQNDFFNDLRICIVGLITLNLANYHLGIWRHDQCSDRLTWILNAYRELECDRFLDGQRIT
jgi:hypothetical protein